MKKQKYFAADVNITDEEEEEKGNIQVRMYTRKRRKNI